MQTVILSAIETCYELTDAVVPGSMWICVRIHFGLCSNYLCSEDDWISL